MRNAIISILALALSAGSVMAADAPVYSTDMGDVDLIFANNDKAKPLAHENNDNIRLCMPTANGEAVHVTILDAAHKTVTSFVNQHPIAYARLPKGVYYAVIRQSGNSKTIRFEAPGNGLRTISL